MSTGTALAATFETLGTVVSGLFGGVVFTVRLVAGAFSARSTRERVLALLRDGRDAGPDEPPTVSVTGSPRVFLVAGEPSGDLHAADLAAALRRLAPDVRIAGVGGPRMAAAGVDLIEDLVSDPVMGLLPVLRKLPFFFGLYRRLLIRLNDERPDVVVGVDYPGLNLRLARAARRRGVPFVQYVAPQVWGWAPWRVKSLARDVDRLLTILPFEAAIFRARGADVAYVGNPIVEHLAERVPDEALRESLRGGASPLIALLPGSRAKEVRDNLPLMLGAARHVVAHAPDARFVVALASERLRVVVEEQVAASSDVQLRVVDPAQADDAMAAADAAITVSGTATLHLVAHGTPPVVIYRSVPAGGLLASALVVAPYFALPNLVAGEEFVPEMLAHPGDAQRIANALLGLLPGGPSRERVVATLAEVRDRLHVKGVPDRAAAFALAAIR